MSNANTARTLARIAAQLAAVAAQIQSAAVALGSDNKPTEKLLAAPANVTGKRRGRQPAPMVKGIKIKREHWHMNFGEFKEAILADFPQVGGAQMKELIESLREIKAAKGIEIKRGRKPGGNVEDAKIVGERRRAPKGEPRMVDVTPVRQPGKKKVEYF